MRGPDPRSAVLKSSPPGLGGSWPIFDGYVLLGDQYKLYEAGRYNDTHVLIGTNSDEGALFVPAITAAAYQGTVRSGYGEYARQDSGRLSRRFRCRSAAFRPRSFPRHCFRLAHLDLGAAAISRPARAKRTSTISATGRPIPMTPQFKNWGAAHGGEIAYVFGNFPAAMPATPADRTVSDEMSSYWVNFAKTGDPTATGLPRWPAFTTRMRK